MIRWIINDVGNLQSITLLALGIVVMYVFLSVVKSLTMEVCRS